MRSRRLAFLISAFGCAAFGASPGLPPSTDWKEVVEPGEPELFAKFGADIRHIQDDTAARDKLPLARGFHTKTHAVMSAVFRVPAGLPEICRQGVFRAPGTYQAWVRFSNLKPQRQADSAADFRAMSVKILEVPGEPLSPNEPNFDLLALNHPLQPARNIHEFISFVNHSFNLLTFPAMLARDIGVYEAGRMIGWMTKNLKAPVMSLGTIPYWSTLPIAFGKHAVKYRFDPRNGLATPQDLKAPNYLRSELIDRLKKGPLRWDLLVQFYTDPKHTPIEDAVVVWNPKDAPFLKVGELEIGQRDLEAAEGAAEEAAGDHFQWNPWHAPAEHRPLGGLQRARRVGYPASGDHRGSTVPPRPTPPRPAPGPSEPAGQVSTPAGWGGLEAAPD